MFINFPSKGSQIFGELAPPCHDPRPESQPLGRMHHGNKNKGYWILGSLGENRVWLYPKDPFPHLLYPPSNFPNILKNLSHQNLKQSE